MLMARTTNAKRTILELAESLIQEKGFNGFSYAHIAEAMGVKNAAIHYHFPGKEDLGRTVVKRYRDRFQLWVNNARVKDFPPEKKLDWFFGIYKSMRADNGKVCLAGSLETEFNSLPESVRDETKALTGDLLAWLEAVLIEGRQAGVLHFNGDPADKAALILSSLQGALQMARALGTKKFHAVVEQNRQDLLG